MMPPGGGDNFLIIPNNCMVRLGIIINKVEISFLQRKNALSCCSTCFKLTFGLSELHVFTIIARLVRYFLGTGSLGLAKI